MNGSVDSCNGDADRIKQRGAKGQLTDYTSCETKLNSVRDVT